MNTQKKVQRFLTSNKSSIALLLTGIVGLLASFSLSIDKLRLLENPDFVPACSLNPIISCLSAMSSTQSEILGVPNSFIGMMVYTGVVVIAGLLVFRATFPKIVWQILIGFALVGILFVHYLIIQSLFVIHVICPWCLSIWVTSPILFFSLIYEYGKATGFSQPASWLERLTQYLSRQRVSLSVIWYTLLIIAIAIVFRDYWASLL